MFSGRFFEFPIVDYENAFKVILTGENFFHVSRPFSVPGVCPESNSAAVSTVAAVDASLVAFNREVGRDINDDDLLADCPFSTGQGTTASIFVIQHWLSRKYGIQHAGYEANFVAALARNCENYRDRESYDTLSGRYRASLAAWHGGRYLPLFNPQFQAPGDQPAAPAPLWSGLDAKGHLHFAENAAGTETPGALFEVLKGLLVPPGEIEIPPDLA